MLPQFTPGVSSGVVDRWQLEVAPLSFSKDRMQFNFRAPGISTVLSNNLFMEFNVEVAAGGGEWDYLTALGPLVQVGPTGNFATTAYPAAQDIGVLIGDAHIANTRLLQCGRLRPVERDVPSGHRRRRLKQPRALA